MKIRTIWIWAFVFGTLAAIILYMVALGKTDASMSKSTSTTVVTKGNAATKPIKTADQRVPLLDIANGNRAVSIPVNEVQGVSGFVQVGDHVDVVVMTPPPQGQNASVQILLQNVKVLAVGQRPTATANGKTGLANGIYHTVTLEVLPTQGSILALTAEKGTISLMLRPPNDSTTVSQKYITLDELNKGEITK